MWERSQTAVHAGVHTSVCVCVCVHVHAREWGCECGRAQRGILEKPWEPGAAAGANHLCLLPWEGLPCSQALLWGVLLSWLSRDPPLAKAGRSPKAVELRPRGAQSLRMAPGSSLVSVCQRSIFLSLFFRQSNQCFSRSPLALIPNTTPPMKSFDFPIS